MHPKINLQVFLESSNIIPKNHSLYKALLKLGLPMNAILYIANTSKIVVAKEQFDCRRDKKMLYVSGCC